jgi:hypothetical protein
MSIWFGVYYCIGNSRPPFVLLNGIFKFTLKEWGEVESLCTQIPNDDNSIDKDGLEFG